MAERSAEERAREIEERKAYNAGEIHDALNEVIGSVERERMHRLPQWARATIHDLVQRIVNLRSALRADPQWRFDMENAPKDGTRVLLWWPHWRDHAIVGSYMATSPAKCKWEARECLTDDVPPLAWQPLPSPPGDQEAG